MVYWITGRAKSGKSSYAEILKRELEKLGGKVLLLDGDDVRITFEDHSYNDDDRFSHIMKIAKFAKIAESQGFIVIIALVSPRKKWRVEARKLFQESILFYIPGGDLWEGTEFEEPDWEEIFFEKRCKTPIIKENKE